MPLRVKRQKPQSRGQRYFAIQVISLFPECAKNSLSIRRNCRTQERKAGKVLDMLLSQRGHLNGQKIYKQICQWKAQGENYTVTKLARILKAGKYQVLHRLVEQWR